MTYFCSAEVGHVTASPLRPCSYRPDIWWTKFLIPTLCFQVWSLPRSDIKIVPRAVPIVPVRVASVFVQKKEEDEEMDTDTDILDIAKEVG